MFSKTAFIAASLAAVSFAAPACQAQPVDNPYQKFTLVAINSGTDVQYADVSAGLGKLWLKRTPQGAVCDKPSERAFLDIVDGAGFLYSRPVPQGQQLWVDRSGMGQGNLGFTTGGQAIPRNGERTGFGISGGHFQFDGKDFIACPSVNGTYGLYVDVGIENPAGNKDCLPVALRVTNETDPIACYYTESS